MSAHYTERRTEDLVLDLLDIQGWPTGRPTKGRLVRQNEYKSMPELAEIFKGKSKRGRGDAYPDFLLIAENTKRPQMVIEAKADVKAIQKALNEACDIYGNACREAGHPVIAVGVAGQEKQGIEIAVATYQNGLWRPVLYEQKPISWIPTPSDIIRLIGHEIINLAPIVPRPEVLQQKADLMNRVLREANVKDEYRPAYIGAMMLALWESHGNLSRDAATVLQDINLSCEAAFARGEKVELARSLHVDEANIKLANSVWVILSTLEKLNVVAGAVDHDYLGQLYEHFFRYTGGNTIGQYFTPRHVTRFMADICETGRDDIIIDPACGTGGFLIACIQRAYEALNVKYEDAIKIVRHSLIGYDNEPVTAALCVANMILRGDGTTGIRKDDCFEAIDYPLNTCQVALINPPFPHKRTDIPPQRFVERALEALENRGVLAVILPTSILVKKDVGEWREKILKYNTIEAVCQLPDELFQPYASTTTSVVLIRKGVPQSPTRQTVFVRLRYDGLTLKKGIRVPRQDKRDDIPQATDAIVNKKVVPGFSGLGAVSAKSEWSPGAYIPSALPSQEELKADIDELLRRLASFYVRYASEVVTLRRRVALQELRVEAYRKIVTSKRLQNASALNSSPGTIGELFTIFYGMKELHSRDGLAAGESLIISPTEQYNGCDGWLTFEPVIQAPFVTVAQTGSIGEAFVQLEPCAVNDDCLILLPKNNNLPLAYLFVAASIIRLERWRFNYGRKLTPSRICDFPLMKMPGLEDWFEHKFQGWKQVIDKALEGYEMGSNWGTK